MSATRQRFYLTVDDLAQARGEDPALRFEGRSPQALADAVVDALRSAALFERWRQAQPDPDQVDPALAPVDPQAQVSAEQADLKCDVVIETDLPMRVLRHRLELLIGTHWTLRDVRAA